MQANIFYPAGDSRLIEIEECHPAAPSRDGKGRTLDLHRRDRETLLIDLDEVEIVYITSNTGHTIDTWRGSGATGATS